MRGVSIFRTAFHAKLPTRLQHPRHVSFAFAGFQRPLRERLQEVLDTEQQTTHTKRLFLLDAMHPICRVHYALKERLFAESGKDSTTVFGFLRHLLSILLLNPAPDYFVVAFDAPGADFRSDTYPGYKAHRDPLPPEILESIGVIQTLLDILGIKWVMVHSIEADDSISVLANRFANQQVCAYILSRDKDFFQVLKENIRFIRGPMKDGEFINYSVEKFVEEYEIKPEQYTEVLALQGDYVDNIPGVSRIGPTHALNLVREYGTIESIFQNASLIKRKDIREALMDSQSLMNALLSRDLVTLATDLNLAPLKFPLEDAKIRGPQDDGTQLREFLNKMSIVSLEKEVQAFLHTFKSTESTFQLHQK